jgi:hypothetical protein
MLFSYVIPLLYIKYDVDTPFHFEVSDVTVKHDYTTRPQEIILRYDLVNVYRAVKTTLQRVSKIYSSSKFLFYITLPFLVF